MYMSHKHHQSNQTQQSWVVTLFRKCLLKFGTRDIARNEKWNDPIFEENTGAFWGRWVLDMFCSVWLNIQSNLNHKSTEKCFVFRLTSGAVNSEVIEPFASPGQSVGNLSVGARVQVIRLKRTSHKISWGYRVSDFAGKVNKKRALRSRNSAGQLSARSWNRHVRRYVANL